MVDHNILTHEGFQIFFGKYLVSTYTIKYLLFSMHTYKYSTVFEAENLMYQMNPRINKLIEFEYLSTFLKCINIII